MFYCRIADINIRFINKYNAPRLKTYQYWTDDTKFDISLEISEEEMQHERETSNVEQVQGYFEYMCFCRALCDKMAMFNACLFHSVFFEVDGKGIAFAAHSGVGKTTHFSLWQSLLGEKIKIINGDKPIIRLVDDRLIGYGSPWCGKEKMGSNSSAILTDVCFIKRSKENRTYKIDKNNVLGMLLDQIYIPHDANAAPIVLGLINEIVNRCDFWIIECNKDISAAETAYKTIFDC